MVGRLLTVTGSLLVSLLFGSACEAQVGKAAATGDSRGGLSSSFEAIVADTESLVVRLELKHSLRLRERSPLSAYLKQRIGANSGSWVLAEYADPASGAHAFVLVQQQQGETNRFLVASNFRPQKNDRDGNEVGSGEWDKGLVYEYDVSVTKLKGIIKYLGEKKTLLKSWGNPEVMDGESWLLSDSGGSRVYFYGYSVPWPEEEKRVGVPEDTPPSGEARRRFGMIAKVFELWDDVRKRGPDRVIEIKKADSR